jgi:hypothetical protein
MRRIFVFFILYTIFQNFFGQGIESVQRVNEAMPQPADGLVFYSLPRTVIGFKVNFSVITTLNGPYCAFAKELLGINGAPMNASTEWAIDSITINTYTDTDPLQIFVIKTSKGFNTANLINFTSSGLLLDPSNLNINPKQIERTSNMPKFQPTGLSEVLMKRNYFAANDTFYKTIVKDSTLIRMPVIKQKAESKTLKDRAMEAVDVIYKIRQRRFEMIMAEDEALPEEKALNVALREMQKTEDTYLSLFTGRSNKQSFSTWYYYVPKNDTTESNIELFRFSSKYGIVERNDAQSSPVTLSLIKDKHTTAISDYLALMPKPLKNYIYYRIPDMATITLNYKGDILCKGSLKVYQYGIVLPYAAFWGK